MIRTIYAQDTWSIRKEAMWSDKDLEFVKLPEDQAAIHYGYYVENTIVGVVSIFLAENGVQFRKLATLEKYRGRGIATQLVLAVEKW